MKEIFEIKIIGRGGQGAKTASELIAEAALDQGKYIQAFPEYGPERSGAPMKTYARISDKPIKTYAPIENPNVVLVIDPTLLDEKDVLDGLTSKDMIIVNTNKSPIEIKKKLNFKGKIFTVDATKISVDNVGVNLPNTPMIGALIKITNIITLDSLYNKVKEKFLGKIGEQKTNATIEAIKKAYDEVKEQ